MSNKVNQRKGIFLWFLVLFGYFTFIVNWLILNQLAGPADGNGWVNHFFGIEGAPTVLTQTVNYLITAMRGLGAILAGWIIVKIGHKYSVVIALSLLSIGVVSSWLPNYPLFIISRMLMALGGTVLIVYVQPIISKYILKNKTKSLISTVNLFGFNLGTAVAWIPFLFAGSQTLFIDNWQLVSTLFALPAIIVLILYIIFGEKISVSSEDAMASSAHEKKSSSKWSEIVKEKKVWMIVLVYCGWITAVVIPTAIVGQYLKTITPDNFTGAANAYKIPLFNILFVIPVVFAPFSIAYFNRSNYPRRYFIALLLLLGVIFMGLSLYFGGAANDIGLFICSFISGYCLWGIQGVILHQPHEWKGNSPARIGIIFGLIWGVGYTFYTFSNLVIAIPFDFATPATLKWLFPTLYLGISSLGFIMAPFILETRPRTPKKLQPTTN